jgi:hypothetical protein
MSRTSLAVDEAPPFDVPLRFFLTAPLFGLAAAVLLFVRSEEIFLSRWTPAALAAVHLLTAGFMLQVMTGALFQAMPVVAGGNLGRVRKLAGVVHPLLTVAAVALVAGFLSGAAVAFRIAAVCGLAGGALFFASALLALLRSPAGGHAAPAMRIAVGGLAAALGAGAVLALVRAGDAPLAWALLADFHVVWALGVGSFGLVIAMAYLVVPMFQMTPGYPKVLARWLAPALLAVGLLPAVGWASALAAERQAVVQVFALAALATVFAVVTLDLQRRRRRARVDVTFQLWRLAMVATVAASATAVAAVLLPDNRLPLVTGVLVLAGIFLPAMIGMLYKIVSFVAWVHLQRQLPRPPRMTEIIPEARVARHVHLHLLALLGLCAAPWLPVMGRLGGALLGVGFVWLLWVELRALRFYRAALVRKD